MAKLGKIGFGTATPRYAGNGTRLGIGAKAVHIDPIVDTLNGDKEAYALAVTNTLSVLGATTLKKKMLNIVAQTAVTALTPEDSGTTVVLGGGAGTQAGQIQVINLPTILAAEVGTYYDFIIGAIGNSGAGYDDFIGTLNVVDTVAVTTADKSVVIPAAGEGAMILADDTSNAVVAIGTAFRCMAINPSTTTAAANVWLLSGTILTAQATGFVTGALFTNP